MQSILSKLPSIVWVILLPLGIVALIGGIIFGFQALATVEGVGSVLLLVILIIVVNSNGSSPQIKIDPKLKEKVKGVDSFGFAVGIVFFALMGISVDQPGNFIYNKPLEIFYCPAETHLVRESVITNPLPGRTDINQWFYCLDNSGERVVELDMFQVILVRFVEYVFIGYFVIWIFKLWNTVKANRSKTAPHEPTEVIFDKSKSTM